MPTLLQRGQTWRATQMKAASGQSVTYRRGGYSVALTAWITQTRVEEVGASGIVLERHDVLDVSMLAADLVLNSQVVTPQRGDRIEIVRGSDTDVYEVMSFADEPPYFWPDSSHTTLTVHTRQVKQILG